MDDNEHAGVAYEDFPDIKMMIIITIMETLFVFLNVQL